MKSRWLLINLLLIPLVLSSIDCSREGSQHSFSRQMQEVTQAMDAKKVNGRAQNAPTREVRNPSDPDPEGIVIRGTVRAEQTSIAGARVRVRGKTTYVTTDDQGRFVLPVDDFPASEVPVTVGKEGWFNTGSWVQKGATGVAFSLERIPRQDNERYQFISPVPNRMGQMMQRMSGSGMRGSGMIGMRGMSNCGNCHQTIYERWKQSSMARTAQNPWVLNLYNGTDALGDRAVGPGYKLDFPNSQGGPCADCHAPSAAVRNPGKTDLNAVLRRGGVDAQGIHCDFCHKIREVTVNNRPGVNGAIALNRLEIRGGMMNPVLAFGPYDDTVTVPMAASYSPLFHTSEFCSSCHQEAHLLPPGQRWDYGKVYPDGDPAAFEGGRAVPTQWTYEEWREWQDGLASDHPDKGKICQDCHMSWRRDMLPYNKFVVDGMAQQTMEVERDPQSIHPHHFEGATETRLKTAAHLDIDATQERGELVVTVSVTNANAGHRLPTGIWMRHLILLVTAVDADGEPLKFSRGETVPDWGGVGSLENGNYAGLPGKGFVRVTADENGNLNVPDWQAVRIVSDNRIPPKQTDTSRYVFLAPKEKGEPTVEAKLIYRRAFKPLADVKKWRLDDFIMAEEVW